LVQSQLTNRLAISLAQLVLPDYFQKKIITRKLSEVASQKLIFPFFQIANKSQ
jgi:hypothetical protein